MNGYPCMNPDLLPGRANGRRYTLENNFKGCDEFSFDD